MKKLYSIILLFSFLVGAIQPILPMIEYQLHYGSIANLVDMAENTASDDDAGMVWFADSDQADEPANRSHISLLDGDYYPIAVQIAAVPEPLRFPFKARLYLPFIKKVLAPAYLPNPPPPRLV